MDGIFNTARGRIRHYATLPAANDALIVVLLQGAESDEVLADYVALNALLANNDEATFTNYTRKSVTSATVTINNDTDIATVDIADQVWTSAGGTTDNTIVKALICYDDDTTAGTDANIVPLLHYDSVVTTDGNDITIQFHPSGIWQSGTE